MGTGEDRVWNEGGDKCEASDVEFSSCFTYCGSCRCLDFFALECKCKACVETVN